MNDIHNLIDKEIFSEEFIKKWIQKEKEREQSKGAEGCLRNYFRLKEDEIMTLEMLDKELTRLKKKYGKDDKYPPEIFKIIIKINMAKIYLRGNKNKSGYN